MKNWYKSQPYWLKGGICGISFILIYFILFSSLISQGIFIESASLLSAPFAAPFAIIWVLLGPILNVPLDGNFITPAIKTGATIINTFGFVILFALYFLIGALIGLAVGQRKNFIAFAVAAIIVAIVTYAGVYILQYKTTLVNTAAKTDLAACGTFPRTTGDGGPTSRYFVCRNTNTGDCYYKTSYFEQIEGCDPKFSDNNPYGNAECIKDLVDVYNFNGNLLEKGRNIYRPEDGCANTEQKYFESKIKK